MGTFQDHLRTAAAISGMNNTPQSVYQPSLAYTSSPFDDDVWRRNLQFPPDGMLRSHNAPGFSMSSLIMSHPSQMNAPPAPPRSLPYGLANGSTNLQSAMGAPKRVRTARDPQAPPPAKRQKKNAALDENQEFQAAHTLDQNHDHNHDQHWASSSVSDTRTSQCCSSCSEGLPCLEPDCGVRREALVPCRKPECSKPVCMNQCLGEAIQQGQPEEVVPSSTRLSNWDYSPWNAQASTQMSQLSPESRIDPNLMGRVEEIQSASGSSVPSTPSMANNMKNTFSPAGALPTPQSTNDSLSPYTNESGLILSGTGTLFAPPAVQWGSRYLGSSNAGNGPSMLNCAWSGCPQPLVSQQEWTEHIHRVHLDPQMTFNCPMPTENCPQSINYNPMHHLEIDHGYNFFDNNNYSCPAPDCSLDQTFLNPAMLHNHFDQAHAMPASGALLCQWNSCGTLFPDQHQLLTHLNEDHQLPDLRLTNTGADCATHTEMVQYPTAIADDELPGDDANNRCKWKIGFDHVCGAVFNTEEDLQKHVKDEHLMSLSNKSGYFCQWENCGRPAKLGDKAGFSQRGKLERHMATHTGYKMSRCDICNEVFSAPQSMKQHRRLHTGEKPWECKYCGKTFPQQSARTIHERTHTNEKPLKCPYPGCGACFSESSNLAKHRKTHGEEGVHICKFPGCVKKFHRLDQLKRHQSIHRKASSNEPGAGSSSTGSVKTETEGSEVGFAASEVSSTPPSDIAGGE